MVENSKNRKKLLRLFLNNKRNEKQDSTKQQQYAESQNRILRSKMKLAKKRAMKKSIKLSEQITKELDSDEHTPSNK